MSLAQFSRPVEVQQHDVRRLGRPWATASDGQWPRRSQRACPAQAEAHALTQALSPTGGLLGRQSAYARQVWPAGGGGKSTYAAVGGTCPRIEAGGQASCLRWCERVSWGLPAVREDRAEIIHGWSGDADCTAASLAVECWRRFLGVTTLVVASLLVGCGEATLCHRCRPYAALHLPRSAFRDAARCCARQAAWRDLLRRVLRWPRL